MARLPRVLEREARREPVEGETYSANPAHPYWRVSVAFSNGLKPSLERIRAANPAQALDFVCARYPFAVRAKCVILGRWDPDSAPIDRVAVRKAEPAEPQQQRPVEPTVIRPSLPPLPVTMTAQVLKPLPRDHRDKAIITDEILEQVAKARDDGLSWPVIAKQLGCAEGNLRRRLGGWQRRLRGEVGQPVGSPEADDAPNLPAAATTAKSAGDTARQDLIDRIIGEPDDPAGALWDVFLTQSTLGMPRIGSPLLMARAQSLEIATRLIDVLSGAGGIALRVVSSAKSSAPVTSSVIPPQTVTTKAGAFVVQITVNPVDSAN